MANSGNLVDANEGAYEEQMELLLSSLKASDVSCGFAVSLRNKAFPNALKSLGCIETRRNLLSSMREAKWCRFSLNITRGAGSVMVALSRALLCLNVTELALKWSGDGKESEKLLGGLGSTRLTGLALAHALSVEDVQFLVASLRASHITGLNLARCALGDKGAQILAASLPEMRLKFLDISHNEIEDVGLQAIAARGKNSVNRDALS